MYTQNDLNDAVDHGIFTRDSVARFEAHVASRLKTHAVDEEHFRLVSGFNDIFVVIACVLTLVSTMWIGASLSGVVSSAATALVAWGLAECFVRRRRLALPGIVLMLSFTAGSVACAALIVSPDDGTDALFTALTVAALASWLHWLRFRVPISVAVCAGALLILASLFVMAVLPGATDDAGVSSLDRFGGAVFFACGVVAFLLAMRFDMRDTARQNDKSDIAFWLHLLAAPLLVHPVFSAMTFESAEGVSIGQALSVVALYLAIGLVSLAIDRRALMVASLSYVLGVFANLLMQFGMVDMNFAITALVVGAALLLLSSYWHRMRVLVIRCLPLRLTRRLPPLSSRPGA